MVQGFTRIEDINGPILLDANIILNAAFLPGGQCERALNILQAKEKAFQIEDTTWAECVNRIHKIVRNELRAQQAIEHFTHRVERLHVLHLPPVAPLAGERRHDSHIVSFAVARWLVVL